MEFYNDFDTSIKKAFQEIDKNYNNYDGLVICGTHSPKDVEYQINKIKEARESGRPFLGICAGMQLAAIEFAINVLNIKDATSEEFGEGTFVVKKLPELRVGMKDLSKMSLLKYGTYPSNQKNFETLLKNESHWHNYYIDISCFSKNKSKDWDIAFFYKEENNIKIPEIMKVLNEFPVDHHYEFIATQFHPEYQSSKNNPSHLLKYFIDICKQYDKKMAM